MIATIKMYEPKKDHLKFSTKRKGLNRFVWVVECGPFVKICPSERSADNYLYKNGFRLSKDCSYYEHTHKSEDVINLEDNYIDHSPK